MQNECLHVPRRVEKSIIKFGAPGDLLPCSVPLLIVSVHRDYPKYDCYVRVRTFLDIENQAQQFGKNTIISLMNIAIK